VEVFVQGWKSNVGTVIIDTHAHIMVPEINRPLMIDTGDTHDPSAPTRVSGIH
jgi:hypothetical protein